MAFLSALWNTLCRLFRDVAPERRSARTLIVPAAPARALEETVALAEAPAPMALPAPAAEPDPPPEKPPWLVIAEGELGTQEIAGSQHTPRILEYHQATSLRARTDEIAWCSAFACWVMERSGLRSTRSAAARSWLTWGQPLESPRPGCICVLSRGEPWQGHVGFWVGERGGHLLLLGGNQGNAVTIASYPTVRLLGYRWPTKPAA